MTFQPPQQPQYVVQVNRQPSNGQAIGAMVLGIIAIAVGIWALVPVLGLVAAFLAFIPAVLAAVFGHLGLRTSRTMGGTGLSQAKTGLVLGYLTLAIILGTTFWWFAVIGSSGS